MDTELVALGAKLAEVVARSTAVEVAERITVSKAKKQDHQTIAELEEIINGLIADKSELVRIAQAFEHALVAQRLGPDEMKYLCENLVPIIEQLVGGTANAQGNRTPAPDGMVEVLKPLLSTETVMILQLLGFNFKRAIGEPLTDLVAGFISSQGRAGKDVRSAKPGGPARR